MRATLSFALIVALASPALAAEQGRIVGGGEVLSMMVSMVIVIGAILALGWLYSRSRFAASGQRGVINVVATRALGAKERLMIVEVGDEQLLIGMTPTTISKLHVLEQRVEDPAEETAVEVAGFSERLKESLGGKAT